MLMGDVQSFDAAEGNSTLVTLLSGEVDSLRLSLERVSGWSKGKRVRGIWCGTALGRHSSILKMVEGAVVCFFGEDGSAKAHSWFRFTDPPSNFKR
jgi:hypothetical protein